MPDQNPLKHIKIEGYSQIDEYKSPKGSPILTPKPRNRDAHGNKIYQHLQRIKNQFDGLKEIELPEGIVRDDVIYVEFVSDFNFEMAFDSFHSDAKDYKYQLLNIRSEIINGDKRFRVNVMLKEGGISHFIKKAQEYINENSTHKGQDTDKPKNNNLISNIESIQLATLEAFWTESSEVPFPNENDDVWWEVWFRKKPELDFSIDFDKFVNQLTN
jgi:hypothetical protein